MTGIASAHLYELDPESGQVVDRGDVVDQLDQAGIRRPGEQQAKIHSRIVQGPDNDLYFASMDEQGENADGSRLPTWGGHLWRLSLGSNRWEHLLATPEALIAVAGGGRFIYALGYFGHVLYRYDTRTGDTRRVEVGSVDGHISRNLLADARGHVYVPRLRAEPGLDGNRVVRVMLVEFGINLEEIRETPLQTDRYLGGSRPTEAHGIVGLQAMADGSIFFTTHVGFLYRVVPPAVTPARPISQVAAEVVAVGWFHPDGPSYPASLFTPDGTTALYGVARRGGDPTGAPDQWLRLRPRRIPLCRQRVRRRWRRHGLGAVFTLWILYPRRPRRPLRRREMAARRRVQAGCPARTALRSRTVERMRAGYGERGHLEFFPGRIKSPTAAKLMESPPWFPFTKSPDMSQEFR